MNIKDVKIVAMDLDGTITQHKQPPCPANKNALSELAKHYKLLMVGAGSVMRIFNQLEKFPIDIIGNYGLQYGKYNEKTGEMDIVMLAPVSVHADYFRQGVGSTMLKLGIEEVKKKGYKGITVEGNYRFYNEVGFKTSSEFGIYPTCGIPMKEPRCMMCQELYEGALDDISGYVVYDMYCNA